MSALHILSTRLINVGKITTPFSGQVIDLAPAKDKTPEINFDKTDKRRSNNTYFVAES